MIRPASAGTGPEAVMPVEADRRLRRRSGQIAAACLVLAAVLPLLVAVGWLADGPSAALPGRGTVLEGAQPGAAEVAAATVLALVPVLFVSLALLAARRCFAAFADGAWFSAAPPAALAACGRWVVVSAAAGLVMPTVLGLVLTAGAPPGHRVLTIEIGSGSLLGLLLGAMAWCLGAVWVRAYRLAEDHAQIV